MKHKIVTQLGMVPGAATKFWVVEVHEDKSRVAVGLHYHIDAARADKADRDRRRTVEAE